MERERERGRVRRLKPDRKNNALLEAEIGPNQGSLMIKRAE